MLSRWTKLMSDPSLRIRAAGTPGFSDQPAAVDEDQIRTLVTTFYARVRDDQVIGPVFAREIEPDRWPRHLDTMCAFWSSVLLRTHRYDGRPLPAHVRLQGLSTEHFERWLSLFAATAADVLAPESAALAVERAERIAHSFRLGIAFARGEDTTAIRPLAAIDSRRE